MPRLATPRDLTDYWSKINELENDADQAYRRPLSYLFSGELDTLTVMKLKEIIDQPESTADGFERRRRRAQHRGEGVLARARIAGRARVRRRAGDGVRLHDGCHDAANASASRGVHPGAVPARRARAGDRDEPVGALAGTAVAVTVASGAIATSHSSGGLTVVGAALLGPILWNITTWYFGLPSSSSHALIGGLAGATPASATQVHWTGVLAKVAIPGWSRRWSASTLGYL